MRLVLVNPNFHGRVRRIAQTSVGPPLGLSYLASAVRDAGHDVSIVDANARGLSTERTVADALAAGPDLVGVTATTPTVKLAAAIAAGVKAAHPDTWTIIGGPHTTALPARSLEEFPEVDMVARGESEETLPPLLEILSGGDLDARREVKGYAYRDQDGSVIDTGIAPMLADLDSITPPARDLLPMERYRCPDSETFTTLLAMRGCPAKCTYCAVPEMFGRGMRYRDAAAVADEMDEVHRLYGVDFFSFLDDTFTTRKKWVRAFCDELQKRDLHRRVRWICLTRPDFVNESLLKHMREAGCARVELGIESGSEHGRKFLRKGVSGEAIVKGFDAARAAGLSTMGFCILNIPGESEEDIESTLALARRCDPDFLQVSFLTPYPGTWLWDEAREKGWVGTEDWSQYSFLNNIVLRHGGVDPDKLQQIYLRFVRRFYLRPRTVWKLSRLVLNRTTRIRPLARTVALGLAAAVLDRG